MEGRIYLVWTCYDAGKLAFLFILALDHCLYYRGVIRTKIDKAVGDAGLRAV